MPDPTREGVAERDPRDGYTADEMNAMVRGETTPAELCKRDEAIEKLESVRRELRQRAREGFADALRWVLEHEPDPAELEEILDTDVGGVLPG